MPASITVNRDQVLLSLGQLQGAVTDTGAMLRPIGAYMVSSVKRTFRDEGSPAGSWPELAASTKKRKGYTAGHKLLIGRGLLFNSIQYDVQGNSVAIGSEGVKYAQVQFLGSADRTGGSVGAQAKIPGRGVNVSAFDSLRVIPFRRYGRDQRTGKDGKTRLLRVRAQGPANARNVHTSAHTRHQNIPARNPLVFRPEDPANIVSTVDAYLQARTPGVRS